MKNATTTIVIALAALSAGHAFAADASTQNSALRQGADVVEPATGQKLGDLFPALYGQSSNKTRAAVQAEVAHTAASAGDVVEPVTGQKLSALFPAAYTSTPVASIGTRAQVRAEAAQARSVRVAGDVVEPATGQKLNVLFASRYNGKSYN